MDTRQAITIIWTFWIVIIHSMLDALFGAAGITWVNILIMIITFTSLVVFGYGHGAVSMLMFGFIGITAFTYSMWHWFMHGLFGDGSGVLVTIAFIPYAAGSYYLIQKMFGPNQDI